jgi:colanic acid biosynthesis glycosyl transferase WcaI
VNNCGYDRNCWILSTDRLWLVRFSVGPLTVGVRVRLAELADRHGVLRLKILIYSANFAPEPTGIGKYSGEMAEWLAAHGHTVRVVCALPYYPHWKLDPAYAGRGFQRDTWRNVSVWRAPIWVPASPTGIKRVLHLLSFAISSLPLVLRQMFWRPDLVVTVAPAFVCAPTGWLAARLTGARAWLHLQDFEVDLAFNMGLLSSRLIRGVVLRLERFMLRRFDRVSSISARMVQLLHRKGVDPARTQYFPNWVDVSRICPEMKSEAFRAELGIAADSVVVLFSGSMGGKQGLMVIPAAAALLAGRKDIVFVVSGDGVMKPVLQTAAADLPNVRFLPLQPVERLGELLCLGDIHLLPQNADATDLVLPSKLSGMLSSGRPVITMSEVGTELQAVVSQCGLVVSPDDTSGLAAAILQLADDRTLREKLGRRARAYAESHFEVDQVLARVFGSGGKPKSSEVPKSIVAPVVAP